MLLDCTSQAAKFNFSLNPGSLRTSSNCVAQLLDGSGWETPTHDVEPENTWTFILIDFAAALLSHVFPDQRNVFQSCNICILYESLRSINIFTCRCIDCVKSCVLGKLLFIAILLKSSWFFAGQDEAHKQSLVNWLQIATLSGESWKFLRYFPNFAKILFNTRL